MKFLAVVIVAGFTAGRQFREPALPFPPARYLPSIEELIVQESIAAELPPDLALQLAWEESRLRPSALRHEDNGSWSSGIFQINGAEPVFDPDVHRQIRAGVAIAAHWWALTHDRRQTKRAFRRGHL